jgi:HEAT repeat protein
MTISIFTTDTALIVRSWDVGMVTMTGIEPSQACGVAIAEIIPDIEARGLLKRFQRVILEGIIETLVPAFHHYLISCPPQNPSKYFEEMQQRVTIAPLQEQETVVGVVVTIEDVTARLEKERDTAEALNVAALSPDSIPTDSETELQVLGDTDWRKRQLVVADLKQRSDPEINAELLSLLRKEHRNPSILNSVLQVLAASQIDPIPALMECLQESDIDLRIYATLSLGERNDPRAIPALVNALDDLDQNVRYHAIDALGNLKAKEAIPRLMEIAESGDFFLAFPAFDALVKIGDQAISPRLLPLLQNTLNWRLRREAVDTLALRNSPELTSELLRLLKEKHRDPSVLNSILQILALSDVDPIDALRECLQDPESDLRIYTVLALGERNDPRTIPILIECLDDPNSNVRYHAIEPLGRLKAIEAVERLLEIARSEDFFLAFPAIEALRQIKDQSVIPHLLPLLSSDFLNSIVIEVLGELGDSTVIQPLATLLNEVSQPTVPICVAISRVYWRYQQIGEVSYIIDLIRGSITSQGQENLLKIRLSSLDETELKSWVLILGTLSGRDVEIALTELLDNPLVRDQVVEILVAYGLKVTELLIQKLESSQLETRISAVVALGRIGSANAVQPLIRLLHSEPELVMVTTSALAQIGDQSAFNALLELLGHEDASVRLGAIAALNSLGHPQIREKVVTLLQETNPYIRESAVKIAGYFAYDESIELLFQCTKDHQEKVRRAAIEHLPYLDDDRVLETIHYALIHDVPSVRSAAAQALGELETAEVVPYLLTALQDQASWVRYHAVRSLSKLWQRGSDLKIESYQQQLFEKLSLIVSNDPANPVKAAAAEAISIIGQEMAIPVLEELIERENSDDDVVRAALMALGHIASASAVPSLLTALNASSPERRLDAIQAFRERGGNDAGVTLQWMAAADPEERVSRAAIDSLGRMGTSEAIAALLELTLDVNNRENCVNTLVYYGEQKRTNKDQYIEAIASGLTHVHPGVRLTVVEVLKRLKHPLASENIIFALKDQETSVRLAAVNALVDLGNRSCQEELTLLSRSDPSPTVRRAAQKSV